VVVISFAATTMDTGVRLQRYILQEIGEMVGVDATAARAVASVPRSTGSPRT
jgi:carbon starvation protein